MRIDRPIARVNCGSGAPRKPVAALLGALATFSLVLVASRRVIIHVSQLIRSLVLLTAWSIVLLHLLACT
jgi:hypothetical protein